MIYLKMWGHSQGSCQSRLKPLRTPSCLGKRMLGHTNTDPSWLSWIPWVSGMSEPRAFSNSEPGVTNCTLIDRVAVRAELRPGSCEHYTDIYMKPLALAFDMGEKNGASFVWLQTKCLYKQSVPL